MFEGGLVAVEAGEDVVGASQVRDLEKRVRELERLLGRKTMENEILTESLTLTRPKKTDVAARLLESAQRRFAMKAITKTLGVARSNLIERRAGILARLPRLDRGLLRGPPALRPELPIASGVHPPQCLATQPGVRSNGVHTSRL